MTSGQDKWSVYGFTVLSDVFTALPAQFLRTSTIQKRRSSPVSLEINTFRGVCANVDVLHLRSGFVRSICSFRSTYGCRNYVAPRRTLLSSLRVCVSCSGGTDLFTNRSLVLTKESGHCCPLAGIEEYRLVGQTWKKGGETIMVLNKHTVKSPFFCVWFLF